MEKFIGWIVVILIIYGILSTVFGNTFLCDDVCFWWILHDMTIEEYAKEKNIPKDEAYSVFGDFLKDKVQLAWSSSVYFVSK